MDITIERRNGKFYVVTWAPWGEPLQESIKGPFDTWRDADAAFYRARGLIPPIY